MDIKIKFFNSTNIPEIVIRRFKIDVKSFDFAEFLSYIKKLFILNKSDIIYIKWKSQNQWLTAEKFDIFKQDVAKSEDSVINLDVFYGIVHFNIECDICGNNIIGDRQKCLQCDDYDICQSCFQHSPNIHKEHCMIILRTPEDSRKFIKSITGIPFGMQSDFRVIDIDLNNLAMGEKSTISTQTETKSQNEEKIDDKSSDNSDQSQSDHLFDSSVTEEYIKELPQNIIESLDLLRSMGFKNLTSPLIAMLVANNGNIYDVLDEIEYSQKHIT